MSSNNSFASKLRAQLRARSHVRNWWLWAGAVLIAFAMIGPSTSIVAKGQAGKHLRVSGAGKTIIEGGTGGVAPVPVTTLGKVTSLEIGKGVATLRGTASVTGIGAGQGASFIASVQAGGPGTTVKLDVSGFTFHEILVEGHIDFD
ncbi:MAG: hypothetical protein DMG85_21890 [Acidobacteria bacterium]|nr:MAG: hypothetical protein DMG85_21890 [Acidobacteriota bacterium]